MKSTPHSMDAQAQNQQIWSHFQNDQRAVFLQARPRLNFLIDRVVHFVRRHRLSNVSVLNIGVGDGYLERKIHSLGFAVTGLDPSAETIAHLCNSGVAGVTASLPITGLASESFTIICASEVIEHLSDDDLSASISEVARLLKPGGAFIGTVPYNERLIDSAVRCPACGANFHRWGHYQSFDDPRLRDLLSHEFDVGRLQTRAFVDLSSRSVTGRLRGAVRHFLGRFGYALAAPSLYFEAIKRQSAEGTAPGTDDLH